MIAPAEQGGDYRLYAVDASIYIFRAYFARPVTFLSPQGYPLNAVEGFTRSLLSLIDEVRPGHLVAAFDESLGQGFREALYPQYKSRRVLPDEALAFQLSACRDVAEVLGVNCLSDSRYEADDLLATVARTARAARQPVTIITRDKDLAQLLVAEGDQLWDMAVRGQAPVSRAQWESRYGVPCDRLADYLAVCGDRVDDIPGVPGIGEKTAKHIFMKNKSLEELYDNLDSMATLPVRGAASVAAKLVKHRDAVFLYRQLTRLCDTVPLAGDWSGSGYRGADPGAFAELVQNLGFSAQWAESVLERYSGVFGR